MKNTLVAYYTNTGSNGYLATRIAKALDADIVPILKKRSFMRVFISTLLNFNIGIHIKKDQLKLYNQVVVCGPIWTGKFLAPMRRIVGMCAKLKIKVHFATCCGSDEKTKDTKYGYNAVFTKTRKIGREYLQYCEAFPIPLVLTEEELKDDDLIMKTRLSDDNFKGEILARFQSFVQKIQYESTPTPV